MLKNDHKPKAVLEARQQPTDNGASALWHQAGADYLTQQKLHDAPVKHPVQRTPWHHVVVY